MLIDGSKTGGYLDLAHDPGLEKVKIKRIIE
jgi:hypothetical protein